MQCGHEIQVE